MATSITTNADLLTYGLITDNEISRLSTERMASNQWSTMHARAWSKVLDKLALRASPLTESDLSDTDELKQATCFFVLFYAYSQAELTGNMSGDRAEVYWKRGEKELAEVRLTVAGGTADRDCYGLRRARRM